MGLLGLAVLGIFVGAAGSELLRKHKPELVKRIEDSAAAFVDSFLGKESGPEKETKDP